MRLLLVTRNYVLMNVIFVFASSLAFAANSGITYQGRILKPDGTPLAGATVQFKLQLRTPNANNCLMYEESQILDMRNSNGAFGLTIADGTGSRTDSTTLGLDRIFSNAQGSANVFTFDPATCTSGSTYNPTDGDGRNLVVLFKDETMAAFEPMPAQRINYVPFAFEAKQVAGFTPASLVRVAETDGTLGNISPLSNANYVELLAVLNGTTTQYQKSGKLNGATVPAMTSGNVLGWNGTAWTSVDPLTGVQTFAKTTLPACAAGEFLRDNGSGLLTCAGVSGASGGTVTQVNTGTGLTGGGFTTTGTISIANGGVDTAQLADSAVTSLKLADGSVATVKIADGAATLIKLAANSVDSSKIVDGSIVGADLNSAINITTSGTLDAAVVKTPSLLLKNGAFTTGFAANAALAANYTLTLPLTAGAPTQVLTTDGSGNLTWTTPAGTGISALTSDVSASGTGSVAATVNSVGGSTAAAVNSGVVAANAATAVNTASTIVKRDASGNFAAGVITSGGNTVLTTATGLTSSNGFVQGGNSFGAIGVLGTNDNNDLSLRTNGTTKLTVQAGGNVGIGTTAPIKSFTVNGQMLAGDNGTTIDASDTNTLAATPRKSWFNNTITSSDFGTAGGIGLQINETLSDATGISGSAVYTGSSTNVNLTPTVQDVTALGGVVGSNSRAVVNGSNTTYGWPSNVTGSTSSASVTNSRYLGGSMTAVTASASFTGAGGGTGGNPTSHGVFALVANPSASGGLHSNIIGINTNPTLSGAATTTNIYGVRATLAQSGTSTATNAYGVYSSLSRSAGTLTNAYGLYLGDVTGVGTNSFSLYSAGGTSYFAGNVGIGTTAPTSSLMIKAGSATAGTAPLKFTAGPVMTTPENGAVEYDGTTLFLTSGGVRRIIPSTTATNDFSNVGSITGTGALTVAAGGTNQNLTLSGTGTGSVTTGSQFAVTNATSSTSATTGAATVSGGLGVAGAVNANILAAANGSPATPSHTFTSDLTTGMYLPSVGSLALSSNGAERVRLDSSGNVGIGTTAPSARLDVTGDFKVTNANAYSITTNGGATYPIFSGGSNVNTVVDNYPGKNIVLAPVGGGNVGIGTTAPAFKLDVNGQIKAGSSVTNNAVLGTTGGQTAYVGSSTAGWAFGLTTDGGTSFPLLLNGNGQIGVGTVSPTAKLHLAAGTTTASTAPLKFTTGSLLSTPEDGALEYASSNLYYTIGATRYVIPMNTAAGNYSNVSTIGNTSGSITMTPMAGNSVVINAATVSTSSTTGALIVSGGAGIAGAVNASGNITSGGSIKATTSAYTPQLYGSTAASGNIKIDGTDHATKGNVLLASAGGNVGIGTAAPAATLDVRGTNNVILNSGFLAVGTTSNSSGLSPLNAQAVIHNSTGANALSLESGVYGGPVNLDFDGLASNGLQSGSRVRLSQLQDGGGWGAAFTISSGGGGALTERLRVDQSGNVGIGTTAPAYRLDVNGTINIRAGGNLTNSGVNVLRMSDGNNTVVNPVTSAGSLYLNYDQGSGTTVFGNGSGAAVASVTANGISYTGASTSVPLDIKSSTSYGGVFRSSTAGNSWMNIGAADTYGFLGFQNGIGGNGIAMLANGNVGIGTTAPSVALEVAGTVKANAFVLSSSAVPPNTGSADAPQRKWRLTVTNGNLQPVGEWNVIEGTVQLLVAVSSETPNHSGTNLYVIQAGYGQYSSSWQNVVPSSAGLGHGESNTGFNLLVKSNGGTAYDLALGVPGAKAPKYLQMTVTELKGGMTFTDLSANATSAYSSAGDVYSNNNVLMGGNVGIGTTAPAAKFDVRGSTNINLGISDIFKLVDNTGTSRFVANFPTYGNNFEFSAPSMGAGTVVKINTPDNGTNGLAVSGSDGITRTYTDTAGNLRTSVGYVGPTPVYTGGTVLNVTGTSAGWPVAQIFGTASQTADLMDFNTNAGVLNAAVRADGGAYFGGNVGIGTTAPSVKLDVAGEIRPGNSSTACASSNEGAQRYNSLLKRMEFCDANNWQGIGPAAGAVQAYAQATCPTGWLPSNGSAVSRTLYASLFATIAGNYGSGDGSTTFNVPDYRGYFLRGQDAGAGNDPDASARLARADGTSGDNVGTRQDDFAQLSVSSSAATASGPSAGGVLGKSRDSSATDIPYIYSPAGTTANVKLGGNETRSKNISVLYCIKY